MHGKSHKLSPAFTLIELLVVIAIIGILAGLLLPVLSSAKDKAVRTIDLNNLKEMMVATHLYATDNQDALPWVNSQTADVPGRSGWLYTLQESVVVLPLGQAFKVETGLLWPALRNGKLYFCPRDGPGTAGFDLRPQQISSYVMNLAVCGFTNHFYPCIKLAEMPPEGIVFWEADEKYPTYFNDGANFPYEGVSRRHNQGAITAAFDGSASFVKFTDWQGMVSSTEKNRLWCNPRSDDGH